MCSVQQLDGGLWNSARSERFPLFSAGFRHERTMEPIFHVRADVFDHSVADTVRFMSVKFVFMNDQETISARQTGARAGLMFPTIGLSGFCVKY